jgi:hypothetical protein
MEPSREELLIGRIIDRCETAQDWDELGRLAAADESVWVRLRAGLRDDAALRGAARAELAFADAVELPAAPALGRGRTWFGVSGWSCAAAFAILWCTATFVRPDPPRPAAPPQEASTDASLGELPRVLVRAQPSEDGRSLRVVSMRRILEESVVQQVFGVDEDEFGAVRPVQVELTRYATPSDF